MMMAAINPGEKIAVIEWEDLECPACAHIFSWEEGSPSLLGQFSEGRQADEPSEDE